MRRLALDLRIWRIMNSNGVLPQWARFAIQPESSQSGLFASPYITLTVVVLPKVGLPIGGQAPLVPMGRVAGREIEILGSHGMAASDMPQILQMVAEGKLKPGLLVGREVSLEEGARAIMAMDGQSKEAGMTMITFPWSILSWCVWLI